MKAIFGPPRHPGELDGELIRFEGPGLPGPRCVDRKAKAKARRQRKRTRNRKRRP